MVAPGRIPTPIVLLFAADILLVAAMIIDFWLGSPYGRLRNLLDLNLENSLATWYSSMQWFCAACLFGLLALHAFRERLRGLLALTGMAMLFLVFSIDEIVEVHEWIGQKTDVLLPDATRSTTPFAHTGIWPFVIGVPVLALLAFAIVRMRHIFRPGAAHARRLLIIGLVVMFTGALVVELAANLIEIRRSGWDLSQVAAEEFLEMLGVSLIVWSGYELLRAYGFELRMPARAAASNRRLAPKSPTLGSKPVAG